MPGWIEDPSLGNSLMETYNGLQAAPGKALNNMATADEIARKRYQDALDKKAIESFSLPEASVAPRRFTAADIANPAILDAPLSALKPASAAVETLTPGSGQIIDPVALAQRQKEREFALQNARERIYATHGEAGMNALGMGRVAARGPGTTLDDRIIDQFYTTGKYMTADERSAPTPHNWAVPNPQGGDPIIVSSTDNKTIANSGGVSLPPGAVYTGPASQTAPNAMENAATASKELELIENRRVQRGYLTDAEATRIPKLLDVVSPFTRKVENDPSTGQPVEKQVRERVLPPWMTNLDALGQEYAAGMARPGPGYTPAPQLPTQNAPLGAKFDPMALDNAAVQPAALPAAAAAPAPRPIVDPNATREVSRGAGDPMPVVEKYNQQKVVQNMEQAKNGYSSIVGNMKNKGQQADLAIIIGAAKVLDPTSVVREGEVETVRKTAGIPDYIMGQLAAVQGGSALTAATRARIMGMINSKLTEDIKNTNELRIQHANQLRNRGIANPDDYLPTLPKIQPIPPEHEISSVDQGAGLSDNKPPAAAAPRSGARTRAPASPTIQRGNAIFGD